MPLTRNIFGIKLSNYRIQHKFTIFTIQIIMTNDNQNKYTYNNGINKFIESGTEKEINSLQTDS